MYYPSLTFNINEPFEIENPFENKQEGPVLATYAEGIHLILFSDSIETDLPIWATQPLALCMTTFDSIPFLVLTFLDSPLSLLYSVNVYQMIGDDRGPWLRSTDYNFNILLVDNKTGVLACMRELQSKLLATIRHNCREQQNEYADSEDVEAQIQFLLSNPTLKNPVTVQRVLERAKLSNLIAYQYPVGTSEATE